MSDRICGICLSRGRRMAPLQRFSDAYMMLLSSVEISEHLEQLISCTFVCWECDGFLNKMMQFQARAVHANLTLQSYGNSINDISFSTLCCIRKVGFDLELIGTDDSNDPAQNSWEVLTVEEKTLSETCTDLDKMTLEGNAENNAEVPEKRKSARKRKAKEETIRRVSLSENDMILQREEARESELYTRATYKCETCITGFIFEELLNKHNSAKHNLEHPHVCNICRQTFPTSQKLLNHRREHYSHYACNECQYTSAFRSRAQRHVAEVHNASVFQCAECGLKFQTKRKLRYHRESVHREPVKCQLCDKVMINRYSLKHHMLTHTGMPTYACALCRKVYRGEAGLYSHMRHFHSDNAQTYCAQCDIHFKNKTIYRSHLKRSERHATPEQLRFTCDKCSKRFISEASLRKHHRYYHLDYVCNICQKVVETEAAGRHYVLPVTHSMAVHNSALVPTVTYASQELVFAGQPREVCARGQGDAATPHVRGVRQGIQDKDPADEPPGPLVHVGPWGLSPVRSVITSCRLRNTVCIKHLLIFM